MPAAMICNAVCKATDKPPRGSSMFFSFSSRTEHFFGASALALLSAVCLLLALSCAGIAMPGMAGKGALSERFSAMDKDNDGKLSPEEFAEGLPQMRDTAFGMMDADNDGFISAEEWENAMAGHMGGMSMPPSGMPMGDAPAMVPSANGTGHGPELIMPSKNKP